MGSPGESGCKGAAICPVPASAMPIAVWQNRSILPSVTGSEKIPGLPGFPGMHNPRKKFREPGLAGPLNLAGFFFIVYDCRDGDGLNRIGCVDFFIHASQAVWEIPDGTYRCIPKKLLSATTAHCGEKPGLPSLKNHREYHGSPLFSEVKPGYLIPRVTVPLRARFHPLP